MKSNVSKSAFVRFKAGQTVRKRAGVYFVSAEAMRRVLTEPRLRLLHLIRARRPRSITELAKLARRDFTNVYNVYDDLRMLAELGLVHLEQGRKSRDQVILTDRIQLKIAV